MNTSKPSVNVNVNVNDNVNDNVNVNVNDNSIYSTRQGKKKSKRLGGNINIGCEDKCSSWD